MRRPPGRLVAVTVAALALLVILALVGGTATAADDGDPSSRAAGNAGTLALYSWLGELGLRTTRITADFDLRGDDVVVSSQPLTGYTAPEVAETERFLRGGGVLILAVDPASIADAAPLLSRLGVAVSGLTHGGNAIARQPLDAGDTVHSVNLGAQAVALDGGAPLLDLHGRRVAAGRAVGRGVAYVIGSSFPLSNDGLRSSRPDPSGGSRPTGSDAHRLLLALVERAHPSDGRVVRVGFDEVHHGEGATSGVSAVLITPVGLAGLLAGLVLIGLLASGGRRLGRPVPAGEPGQVPSSGTLVDALAGLYGRSARRGSIAAQYAEELRLRVGAATGVEPGRDDAAFAAALSGWGGESSTEVAAVLGEAAALASGAPTDRQLVALARRVDAAEALFAVGSST